MNGLWIYPYKLAPFLSVNLALDTALVPVIFMFVYQWSINHSKNYYLYGTLCCLFFSFLFKPALVAFGLFRFGPGTNYIHLLACYLSIMCLSRWITNLFLYAERTSKKDPPDEGSVRRQPRTYKINKLFQRSKAR
ncbi:MULTISPECIES: hypothetical protein [Paenibacillus]|uniref:hypothetical protein n=1 Tax=Paenibacillus TaxID=44249 RepID=UPI0022B88A25|nr:hypothetical protein [Paenibacillus caseinilyticus]MCZ8519809.1 hypothetical protein [Paenibacillus caseinilyticus]